MTDAIRSEMANFLAFIRAMPAEKRARLQELEIQRAEEEHRRFQEAYRAGHCHLCGGLLTGFDLKVPCIHWLLKPPGFAKFNFLAAVEGRSMYTVQAFLRYVANEEGFAQNINDLTDEGTGKLVEVTIRYRDLEWSFSCGLGDFLGHAGAADGSQRPHYHFQMRINQRPFINYNDFHLPLSDNDIRSIELKRRVSPILNRALLMVPTKTGASVRRLGDRCIRRRVQTPQKYFFVARKLNVSGPKCVALQNVAPRSVSAFTAAT